MRNVVVNHLTLDGVMQGPDRPDEDTRGGFTAGGWAAQARDQRPWITLHASSHPRAPGIGVGSAFFAAFFRFQRHVASSADRRPGLTWFKSGGEAPAGPAPTTLRRRSGVPRTFATDALGRDAKDIPRSIKAGRREDRLRAHVDVGQPLKKLGGPAYFYGRQSMDDEVLAESAIAQRRRLQREDDAWVTFDVLDLLAALHVAADDLLAVEADPDATELSAAVSIQGHEMGEGIRFDQRSRTPVQHWGRHRSRAY
jgi:hypothetical protein